VLSDVSHFDLPARRVGGVERQQATLECLKKNRQFFSANANERPVRFADRIPEDEQRIDRRCCHKVAECARHVMPGHRFIAHNRRRWQRQVGSLTKSVGTEQRAHPRTDAVGRAPAAVERHVCCQLRVGWRMWIVDRIASDRNGGGRALFDIVEAGLHSAGDQFNHQPSAGNKPGGSSVATRIVHLHPRLVEVLHQARIARCAGEALIAHLAGGCAIRPGATRTSRGNRLIGARP